MIYELFILTLVLKPDFPKWITEAIINIASARTIFCLFGSLTRDMYLRASLVNVVDRAAPTKKSPSIMYCRSGGLKDQSIRLSHEFKYISDNEVTKYLIFIQTYFFWNIIHYSFIIPIFIFLCRCSCAEDTLGRIRPIGGHQTLYICTCHLCVFFFEIPSCFVHFIINYWYLWGFFLKKYQMAIDPNFSLLLSLNTWCEESITFIFYLA